MMYNFYQKPSYLMSGDIGDLIYSLPIIQHYGKGDLYLGVKNLGTKIDGTSSGFTPETIKFIKPLLEVQPYINKVEIWNGQNVTTNIDSIRNEKIDYCKSNLSKIFLDKFNVPMKNDPWLFVNPIKIAPVVFARSNRYHNKRMQWAKQIRQHQAIFLGLLDEYNKFTEQYKKFGIVKYYPVQDLLEMTQIIAGAELFIGNQSAPYAIAEALKKNTIQEVFVKCPNCVFNRTNAKYIK